MPEISRFYGIIIYMYMSEHNPPHFHVWYENYKAIITIKDGIIMNEVLTVEQAKHIGGYTLMLIFNNGEKRKFDFSSLLDKGVCSKLRDMDYFKNFKVDGFSVDWNNEIGFAPEFLYENGAALME